MNADRQTLQRLLRAARRAPSHDAPPAPAPSWVEQVLALRRPQSHPSPADTESFFSVISRLTPWAATAATAAALLVGLLPPPSDPSAGEDSLALQRDLAEWVLLP